MATKTLFLRHSSGATHAFSGRRLAKLLSELKADRGGPEVLELVTAGYAETLGGQGLEEATWSALEAEASGRFTK